MFLALLILGCMENDTLNCDIIAISTEAGIDNCDLQACEACIAECGSDCLVLQSYPPIYSCDDIDFDVYDFCEDWEE